FSSLRLLRPRPPFPTRRSSDLALDDSDSGLYRELQNLRDRADSMMNSTQEPDFLDQYVVLLSDYRLALEQLRKQEFTDIDEDKRSEEHTSELQSRFDLVCRLLL